MIPASRGQRGTIRFGPFAFTLPTRHPVVRSEYVILVVAVLVAHSNVVELTAERARARHVGPRQGACRLAADRNYGAHDCRLCKIAESKMAVEVGSDNVFADLGLPDAAELDIKVRLAVEIVRLINARRLSQMAAGALLKINQPKISALKNYKLDGFSVERLMTFLLALGQDVEIRIRSRGASKSPGKLLVETH
jgi:predicted XRE-type DNA-binding protein